MVMLCSIISRFVFVRARVMSVKLSCFLSCFCCVLRVISVGKLVSKYSVYMVCIFMV